MNETELLQLSIADLVAIVNYCGDDNRQEIALSQKARKILNIKLKLA